MLDELLSGDEQTHYGWFWQLRNLPDEPESRYLYAIMAGHDFQEGLKNYRDLTFLGSTLDVWSDSTQAFGDMIDTREHAYAQRLPQVDQLLASGAVDQLQHRRDELDARLAAIDARQDVAALGSPEERAHWEQIRQIEDALSNAPHDAANDALRDRVRLVKGVMFYQLTDAFKARQWEERRTLKDLDLALHEAQSRWIRVDRARHSVPTNTGEFAARLAALKNPDHRVADAVGECREGTAGLPAADCRQRNSRIRRIGWTPTRCRRALHWRPCTTRPPTRRQTKPPPRPPRPLPRCQRLRRPERQSEHGNRQGAHALLASAWLIACASGGAIAADHPQSAQTIGDLVKKAPVVVQKNTSAAADSAKAMENYKRFLELQRTDPKLRAEAMRRLGDLNQESDQLDTLDKDLGQVDLNSIEAIRLYTMLLKAYPDYERNDQVLYQMARAYEATSKPDQALATLDQLIARYPTTRLWMRSSSGAERLLFSAKDYRQATTAYAVVIRPARPRRFYTQALYKHGWSLFKQSLNEESLPSFAGVLDQQLLGGRAGGPMHPLEKLSRANRELVDDTLRVMSITFSYLDGARVWIAFLAGRGNPAYAYLLYSRLGDLYVEKERYQDAAGAYRAFVARDAQNVHAPDLAMQAIQAYTKGGFTDLVIDGKREYAQNYDFSAPFWKGRAPRGLSCSGQGAADQSAGSGHLLPRRRAKIQAAGGLRPGGALVSQLPHLLPGCARFGGHQLPAGRCAV